MFSFTCTPDGGDTFTVEAKSRAIAAWETAPGKKGRSLGSLSEDMHMADLVDLAWYAAVRAEKTSLDIVQWRAQVDIDVDQSDDEAGPT